jgi:hypothetical protein
MAAVLSVPVPLLGNCADSLRDALIAFTASSAAFVSATLAFTAPCEAFARASLSFAVGATFFGAADFVAAVDADLVAGLVALGVAACFVTAAAGGFEDPVTVSSLVTSGVAFSLSVAIFYALHCQLATEHYEANSNLCI